MAFFFRIPLFSGLAFFSFSGFSQSLEELNKAYKAADQDSIKLQILSDMNWATIQSSPQKAAEFAKQEIELAKKAGLQKWIAQGYNDLGMVQQKESQFKAAIHSHEKALEIRKKTGNADEIGSSYSKIGICYSELDSLEKAQQTQLKALVEFRKCGNRKGIAYTLNNLAFIFQERKQFEQMRPILTEAFALNTELKDDYGILGSLNYLGSLDEAEFKYDSALLKYQKALLLSKKLGSPGDEASFLNNIGTIFSRKGNTRAALNYYLNALKLVESVQDFNSIILYKANIGNILFRQRELEKAEAYLRSALFLAEKEDLKFNKPQIYLTLGNLYTVRGNIDSASKYFDAHVQAIQKAFSDKVARQTTALQTQYEIDIREQQKQILHQKIQIKETNLSQFRWLALFLAISIILMVFLFLLWKNRQKLLVQKQLDAERLVQQEQRTKAVIEAEEKERTRIAKELHDGIGQQLSAAKMNLSSLQMRLDSNEPEHQKLLDHAVSLIDDSVKEVRSVSHQMMANALLKNGLAAAIRDFVQKLGDGKSLRTELEIVDLHHRLDPAIEMMLYRVLQELVNNIIRHAQATIVNIQLIRHEDSILLQVEDNGIGFDPLNRLHQSGIGLENIRSRVEILHGSFFIDSQPGHGTTSSVEIPID